MALSEAGAKNRIFSVEWHAELWRRHGVPLNLCEAMMRYCSEVVEADFYGIERPDPDTEDPQEREWCLRMRSYFDRLFSSHSGPVSFE